MTQVFRVGTIVHGLCVPSTQHSARYGTNTTYTHTYIHVESGITAWNVNQPEHRLKAGAYFPRIIVSTQIVYFGAVYCPLYITSFTPPHNHMKAAANSLLTWPMKTTRLGLPRGTWLASDRSRVQTKFCVTSSLLLPFHQLELLGLEPSLERHR